MSNTQECLMVLALLEDGRISVAEAEKLIFAMQPQNRSRLLRREILRPDVVSVMVDSNQPNLGEIMHKVSRAFELAAAGEVHG
jgi:hypothetical protein